jgi:hypothetical protein
MPVMRGACGKFEPREQRLPWEIPALRRLRAGDAENAAGTTPDDPINKS